MVRSLGFTIGLAPYYGRQRGAAATLADWPQFRGPGGSGVGDDTQFPTEWSPERNIRWKAALPGVGWSSPVVWGDKVFLTAAITENQPKLQPFGPGGGRPGGVGDLAVTGLPLATGQQLVTAVHEERATR